MSRLFVMHCSIIVMVHMATSNDHQITSNSHDQMNCLNFKPGDTGYIQLTKKDEPGEPLIIYGKIIDGKTKQPIKNGSVFLYQTDSSGIYNRLGGADEQARISGTLHTNESGCFKIKTILPGDYPGQKNSRHIHYIINAKGYRELKSLFFFKGFTTSNITGNGPLTVLDIKKNKEGFWIGTTDIKMEPTDN